MAERARFLVVGEQGMAVELGDAIDEEVTARVHRLAAAVRRTLAREVLEVVPTYRSLFVAFDPLRVPRERLARRIGALLERMPARAAVLPPGRTVRIPVCYGGEHGPDLEFVARHAGLAPPEVVDLHASTDYRVYMLGFTPGFPYLGGMSPRIATPRLEQPRTRIPGGSVAIGGEQTGIYPVDSPGGWRLIGRTPLRLFDPSLPEPFLVAAGDRVRFDPIAPDAFRDLEARGRRP